MKTLYLDCFSGISGNMFIGMLIQAGVPFEKFKEAMNALNLTGYDLVCRSENKNGIQAIYYNVHLKAEAEAHQHHDHHVHEHNHGHDQALVDTTGHQHHHAHRGLPEITQIIEKSSLDEAIKKKALEVFQTLGAAEARVHGVAIDQVHFHEVGAIDCILDIVGTLWCLKYLGIEQIAASPLHVGSGFVLCAHGLMPVPAPATAELLAGIPWYSTEIKGELVTPTGAALVNVLAQKKGGQPKDFVYDTVAYGAGSKDLAIPNVLRGFLGQAPAM